MSLEEVRSAVIDWQIDEETSQSPGFSEQSAYAMLAIAREADVTEPHAELHVMWSGEVDTDGIHYALMAVDGDGTRRLIFNPVASDAYPRYNGDADDAPGRLKDMMVKPDFF